jgi:hypothetical protein
MAVAAWNFRAIFMLPLRRGGLASQELHTPHG